MSLDYSDIAALVTTTPVSATELVSTAPGYLQDIKAMLKSWYQATHQWITMTTAGTWDLSSIGSGEDPVVAHAGCIKFTGGVLNLTQFTNGIVGQMVYVLNAGSGTLTVTHGAATIVCGTGADRDIGVGDMACFKMTTAGIAYEVPYMT